MINEEQYLKSRMGKSNPFRVPEGYFGQLTHDVMSRLPEAEAEPQRRQTRVRRLRPWLYAAACLVVAVFVATLAIGRKAGAADTVEQQMAQSEQTQQTPQYLSDTYIDEEADYAMVGNQEIYEYLLAEM